MNKEEIEEGLKAINTKYPEKWYHNYSLGHGIATISSQPEDDNFLIRSDIIMETIYLFLGVRSPEEISSRAYRLLDLASAEGLQTMEAAMHGFNAVGVEGRQLFIERAEFVKKVLNRENVQFIQGDVRKVSKDTLGAFDVTLCLGILYHLDKEAMIPFFTNISDMTKHLLIIDTHVNNSASVERYKLHEEDNINEKYFGRMHYEHPTGLSPEKKQARLRASLDNEKSFWFDYESLCQILEDHGFNYVLGLNRPVHNMNQEFRKTRVLLAALKIQRENVRSRCYSSTKKVL